MNFVELEGRRFDFHDADLWLYHCQSGEADWSLRLTLADGSSREAWLAGTAAPPVRAEDLHEQALVIESDAIDELFTLLRGAPITVYPNGEHVCRAHFVGEWSEEGLRLIAGFDYEWDRALDEGAEASPEELPRARLEFRVRVAGIHAQGLPEDAFDKS